MTTRMLAALMLMAVGVLMPQNAEAEEYQQMKLTYVSASESFQTYEGEGPENLVDGRKETQWRSIEQYEHDAEELAPFHIIVKTDQPRILRRYSLFDGSDRTFSLWRTNWRNWTISGTNDDPEGSESPEWTVINSVTDACIHQSGQVAGSTSYFDVTDNSKAYQYFKVEVTAVRGTTYSGGDWYSFTQRMSEMIFYELHPICPDGHDCTESHVCDRCGKWINEYQYIEDNSTTYVPGEISGECLFDTRYFTKWLGNISPAWVEFKTWLPVILNGYRMAKPIDDDTVSPPVKWKLQGKLLPTDDWTDLDVRDWDETLFGYEGGVPCRFSIRPEYQNNEYQYFRLEAQGNSNAGGGYFRVQLAEFELDYHFFNSKNECLGCLKSRCEHYGHVWGDDLVCILCGKKTPDYFSLKAVGGDVEIDMVRQMANDIQYTIDRENWETFSSAITIPEGESRYFRMERPATTLNGSQFKMTSTNGGKVAAGGNIQSLIDPDVQTNQVGEEGFKNLFKDCDLLISAPKLPATDLGASCYSGLFNECTNLQSDIYVGASSFGSSVFSTWLTNTGGVTVHFPYEAFNLVKDNSTSFYSATKIVFEADNLVLSDDQEYVFGTQDPVWEKAEANAKQVSYSRDMTQEFGTLCLPFQITVGEEDDFDLYVVKEAAPESITLQRVNDQLAAGQGAIVRRKAGGSGINISASDVQLLVKPLSDSPAKDGWKILGNYEPQNYYVASNSFKNSYYLDAADGKLHNMNLYRNNYLNFPRYRAYLENVGGSKAKAISVNFGNSETGLTQVLNGDDINVIYGLDGQQRSELREGVNIVQRANGSQVKIIINN